MTTKKPRILHLEDEPDWTRKVRQYLGEDYEVIATPWLSHGKELLETEDIALALVDLSLVPQEGSDTSGFQFIDHVRSSDVWMDLPVIILTAYDSMERMRSAFKEYKVFDFLAKKDAPSIEQFRALIAQAVAAGPHRHEVGEPPRALVVEDDPQWQSRIKRILEEEGCQVDTTSTYGEAVDRLTSHTYHLATVDIRLSDLNSEDIRGVELIDIIRRLGHAVDVIFISAYGTPPHIRKAAFDLGARDFMDKGDFQAQRLRYRVRRILRHLIYITVTVGTGAGTPILKHGEMSPLTISVSRTRPPTGVCRSVARPVPSGRFEVEAVVQPYEVDVLPGSTQLITIRSDDTAEPAAFEIIPLLTGRIEVTVDFLYRSSMLGRMSIGCEVVD